MANVVEIKEGVTAMEGEPASLGGSSVTKPRRTSVARFTRVEGPDLPIDWVVANSPVPYLEAVSEMEACAAAIGKGEMPERVWLVEHPPLYTAGTSAKTSDLLAPDLFPVFQTGRGGEYTYHGPGQRVAYVMLDLNRRHRDLRLFVAALESWIIATLARFNIVGERRPDRVGVWVRRPDKPLLPGGGVAEDKIAAIGIRVRRWVSFHGISLNIDPDLGHYRGIVPCGISGYGVTSFEDLGQPISMAEVDMALRAEFEEIFGRTLARPAADTSRT